MLSLNRRSALGLMAGAGALLASASWGGAAPSLSSRATDAGGYGVRSDGRSDDSAALQAAIDGIASAGGGELKLRAGAVTVARVAPVVLDNVHLNLNGGTLLLLLSRSNATGVRLRSGSSVRNGAITVRSSGTPGMQSGIHAPVLVGALYGEGGAPGRVSPDEGVGGWVIRDLVLSTDKDANAGGGNRVGAPAIQIMGGAHDGLIENITVPDSAHVAGGVHLDWGTVGPISSDTIPENRELFRTGRGYTTHPNGITIRKVRIGRLTRPAGAAGGSFGVRLSGVYNVSVSDIIVDSVTEAAFCHTAGDLGFEFAPPAIKPFACKGIRFSDGAVSDGSTAYLIWTDSYADNVGRAALRGYKPLLDPIHSTDLVFENIRGNGRSSQHANFGVRVNHQRGGRIVNCVAQGYKRGFYIDEQVDGLVLVRPTAIDSAEHGISVEHPSRPPRNIRVEDPVARSSGRKPGGRMASGILIGRSDNVQVIGGDAPLGAYQKQAIRITREARNAKAAGTPATPVSRD